MFLKNKYQIIYNESQGDHRQVVVFKFEMNIMFTFRSAEIMPIFGKLLLVCKFSKCDPIWENITWNCISMNFECIVNAF